MVIALIGGLSLLATPALAAPNPPGNNGTVKVDRLPFDDAPDNQPHVGCTFQVDFYGFDEGDLNADVTFAAQPPTPPGGSPEAFKDLLTDTVFIGEDDNSGGGSEAGLDASQTYTLDLTGITPHPQQGVHVKLTIHADGSQGADTKFKVFWVTGCGGEESTTTTTMENGSTTTTMKGGSTTTTMENGSTTTSENGSTTTTMASGSSSEGSASSGGGSGGEESSSAEAASSGLPLTGANTLPVVLAALALLGIGVSMIARSRQRRRT